MNDASSLAGWRGALLLSFVSLTVFCVAVELAIRAVDPDLSLPQSERSFRFTQEFEFELPHHRRDAVVGWRLVPGTYGRMHINSQGYRGRDFEAVSPGAPARIAHLGDSSTMGFSVTSDADVYPARLESMLREAGEPFATLNFGVDGYSSHQGRSLLPEVLATWAPRYVTLYFGYNDHHYANTGDRDTRYAPSAWRDALEASHGYRFFRRQVLRLLRREATLEDPVRRVPLEEFAENLREMVAAVRANAAVPVLLTTPLRPGTPLIQNEVRVEMDGTSEWVTQDWWLDRELRRRGLSLGQARERGKLTAILDAAIARHPDWPWLHHLRARELARAGDASGAAAALRAAAANDSERRVMEEYNDAVRRVAAATKAPLVDLARALAGDGARMFNDVVHPSARGHAKIGRLLRDRILALEDAAASSPTASGSEEAP